MEKGTHIILKGYKGDSKFLNNRIGKVIDVIYDNQKVVKVRLVFDKPVYQPQPVRAEIVIWATDPSHIIEFCRTPIRVGRTPILSK